MMNRRPSSLLWKLAAFGVLLPRMAGGPPAHADARDAREHEHWVGTWSASPVTRPFASAPANRTVREIVHVSIGGRAVRLRLTNVFGKQPLTIDAVSVGIQRRGATLVPGSNHAVTFGGGSSIVIPPASEALSDAVPIRVGAQQNLAVSLFIAGTTRPITLHTSQQTNYVSPAGDFVEDESGDPFTRTTQSWYFLDGVDVLVSRQVQNAIVAFGDSITDGVRSTVDANNDWPDVLARRFLTGPRRDVMAVLNEGIAGNRVLNDSPCFGVSALARLDRDVLAQTAVRAVILLEGINDIGFSEDSSPFLRPCRMPDTDVSPAQIIAGYLQIIDRVHDEALKIFGGTLTPFEGASYWSPVAEQKREAVNDWILTSGAFDGVVDFAGAVADPSDPLRFAPPYDSGDHLHPSDAGYRAMAEAVNLTLFRPRRPILQTTH